MNGRMTGKATRNFALALVAGSTLAALLASCTSPRPASKPVSVAYNAPRGGAMALLNQPAGGYEQCVPFARDVSGIQLYGDAWTWWAKADGRYARGEAPKPGSVLSLKKTSRLTAGHLAVVAAVVEPRRILVDHANWGDNRDLRSKIHQRQPVIDVSPNNDWSEVRFMNTLGSFGAVYPAHGFIYAESAIASARN